LRRSRREYRVHCDTRYLETETTSLSLVSSPLVYNFHAGGNKGKRDSFSVFFFLINSAENFSRLPNRQGRSFLDDLFIAIASFRSTLYLKNQPNASGIRPRSFLIAIDKKAISIHFGKFDCARFQKSQTDPKDRKSQNANL